MTNRTVAVSLTAQVSSYIASFNAAEAATRKTGNAAQDASKKFDDQNAAMSRVGVGLVAFGAVAAAAVGLAVAKYAEFDEAISSVQAATHETTENMALLRDAAIEAGASTVFTAKEAANAIEELAKAGVSTADILGGGLAGALDLASAGGIEVADAAATAATAMTQFSLAGEQVPHIADLLAAGAGKAQGSVADLSAALNQGGLVASQAGFSIEETTGALAAFAAAGLIGSDAGTSLKTAILALQNPSAKAAGVMEEYGLKLYDTEGNMLSMADIANQLSTKLGGLTDEQRNAALATIFGNDAVRAANVLYANGSAGITEWTDKVNDTGYAAETARIKLDNLNGDVEKLGGAFDSALIKTGSGANDALRFLVQTATSVIDAFGDLPPVMQQGTLAIAALTGAVALGAGGFLLGVPKIAEFSNALKILSGSDIPGVSAAVDVLSGASKRAGSALSSTASFLTGPWGLALAAAAVAVTILQTQLDSLKATSEEFQNAIETGASPDDLFKLSDQGRIYSVLNQATGSAKEFKNTLDIISNNEFLTGLNLSAQQLRGSLRSVGEELATTAETNLPAAQAQFKALTEQYDLNEAQQIDLLNAMGPFKDKLVEVAKQQDVNVVSGTELENNQALLKVATDNNTASTDTAAEAYIAAADEVSNMNKQVLDLVDTINKANDVGQDAVSANAKYQTGLAGISDEVQKQKDAFIALQEDGYKEANGSLDGFVGTLDGFTLSLDEATEAGATNAANLSSVASAAQDAARATYEQDLTTMSAKDATDKYIGTLADSRQALIDTAVQNGYSADEVQKLIDKVYEVPSQRQIDIIAQTAGAEQQIQRVLDLLDSVPAYRQTSIGVSVDQTPFYIPEEKKATGGAIRGPGGPTDDTAGVFKLSNGEHVLTAADVAAMGGQQGVYGFRAALHNAAGYAYGGAVQATQALNRAAQPVVLNQTINAPTGVSGEVIGRSAAAYSAQKLRSRIS